MDEKGNKRVYNSEFQKKFELEKDKLFELVKGVGIYDNELECIREYVQNAMDACKMQLWIDLREGRYEEDIAPELVKSREFMPYNIPKRIWDNYEVKIQMGSLQEETGKIKIKIQDNGIGIEDECLKVISTVGAGWRKRKKYVNEISIMPAWLKPTGGFGMGIQSAFMATDEVIIDTKTKDDYMGRRIQLEKPGSGGHIYFEEHAQKFQGTKIELEIPTEYFQSWNRSVAEDKKHLIFDEVDMKKEFMDVDIFSSEYIEESVWLVLNEYIKKTIPNPLIPLMLTRKNYRKKEVGNPFWNRSIEEDELEIKTWNDKKYAIHYGDVRISFWDIERVNFVSIGWKTDYNSVQKHKPCYKNVIVAHDDSVRVFEKFDFYIDFMGESANNALMVHRNEFSKKFRKQIEKLLVEYQKLYFHLFCELEEQSKYGYMLQDRDFAIMRMVHAEEKDVSRIKEEFHNTSYTCKCRKLYLDKSVNGEDAAQSEEISGVSERDELINFEEILAKLHELRKGCASGDIKGVCLLIKPEDKVDKEIKEEAVAQYFYPDLACENKNIVLEKLMEDGVIIDSELFNILKYYYPNSRRRYNIEEPGERIFSFFVFGDDKNGNKYSENDFYTISCPKVYEERAIIKAAVHQGKYFPLLQVDCTPKMKNEEGEGPYIISPIPQEWYEKRFNEERKISKQEFINFITGKDDKGVKEKYNNLLNWVQKHAVNKEGRNNINRIREEYNRYISMIYDNVIKKRKK